MDTLIRSNIGGHDAVIRKANLHDQYKPGDYEVVIDIMKLGAAVGDAPLVTLTENSVVQLAKLVQDADRFFSGRPS